MKKKYYDGQIIKVDNEYSIVVNVGFRALKKKKTIDCIVHSTIAGTKQEIREHRAKLAGKKLCVCGRIIQE